MLLLRGFHCNVDRPITEELNNYLYLDIGNGVSLEKVDKFLLFRRYLLNNRNLSTFSNRALDTDGGCDSAVTTRVRSAGEKFCE